MTSNAHRTSKSAHRIDVLEDRVSNIEVGGVPDHNNLNNRDAVNAHPILAITGLQAALDSKVAQEVGKGLSTHDFTTSYKNKLDTVQAGAQNNTASNIGLSGAGIFQSKDGSNLLFKKIVAGANTTITEQPETITISSSGGTGGDIPVNHNELLLRDATDSHPISAITGLQSALNSKAPTSHTHTIANVTGLQTVLDGKSATGHTHTIANITGLQTALDGKAATSHTHTIANVTGLQTALDGKEDVGVAQSLIDSQKLVENVFKKSTLQLAFDKNEYKVYESPYGLEPKQIFDVLTTTRATTGTRTNPFGVVDTIAVDTARIQYDAATGKPLGLLAELAATNRVINSDSLSSFSVSAGVTKTLNYADGPLGPLTATRVQFSGADQRIFLAVNRTAEDTQSIYIKGNAGETIRVSYGTAENFVLSGGWQRISRTTTGASGASTEFNISTFSSATARDILVCAAQLEAGSVATSYIPTAGSAVTRNAESHKTAIAVNKDRMVLYAEVYINKLLANYSWDEVLKVGDNIPTGFSGFSIQFDGGSFRTLARDPVLISAIPTYSVGNSLGRFKVAALFDNVSQLIKLCVNGNPPVTLSVGGNVDLSLFSSTLHVGSSGTVVGGNYAPSHQTVSDAAMFVTLSDAELIALTTRGI